MRPAKERAVHSHFEIEPIVESRVHGGFRVANHIPPNITHEPSRFDSREFVGLGSLRDDRSTVPDFFANWNRDVDHNAVSQQLSGEHNPCSHSSLKIANDSLVALRLTYFEVHESLEHRSILFELTGSDIDAQCLARLFELRNISVQAFFAVVLFALLSVLNSTFDERLGD